MPGTKTEVDNSTDLSNISFKDVEKRWRQVIWRLPAFYDANEPKTKTLLDKIFSIFFILKMFTLGYNSVNKID